MVERCRVVGESSVLGRVPAMEVAVHLAETMAETCNEKFACARTDRSTQSVGARRRARAREALIAEQQADRAGVSRAVRPPSPMSGRAGLPIAALAGFMVCCGLLNAAMGRHMLLNRKGESKPSATRAEGA